MILADRLIVRMAGEQRGREFQGARIARGGLGAAFCYRRRPSSTQGKGRIRPGVGIGVAHSYPGLPAPTT